DPVVGGGALPPPARVKSLRGGRGGDLVGESEPFAALLGSWMVPRDLPQARGADQAAVGEVVGIKLPDPGVWLTPAARDRLGCGLSGAPAVGVDAVVVGGRREQQERLAEGVQLKLLIDPVADRVAAPGVARQIELELVGDAVASGRVGRPQLGAVGQQLRGN